MQKIEIKPGRTFKMQVHKFNSFWAKCILSSSLSWFTIATFALISLQKASLLVCYSCSMLIGYIPVVSSLAVPLHQSQCTDPFRKTIGSEQVLPSLVEEPPLISLIWHSGLHSLSSTKCSLPVTCIDMNQEDQRPKYESELSYLKICISKFCIQPWFLHGDEYGAGDFAGLKTFWVHLQDPQSSSYILYFQPTNLKHIYNLD